MAEKLLLADDTRIDNWGENVDSEMPPWDEKTDGRDEVHTSEEDIVLEDHEVVRGEAHTDILEDHEVVRGEAHTDILEDREVVTSGAMPTQTSWRTRKWSGAMPTQTHWRALKFLQCTRAR
jgi:hypothetical protein